MVNQIFWKHNLVYLRDISKNLKDTKVARVKSVQIKSTGKKKNTNFPQFTVHLEQTAIVGCIFQNSFLYEKNMKKKKQTNNMNHGHSTLASASPKILSVGTLTKLFLIFLIA